MGMSSGSNGRLDSISWRRTQVRCEVSSDVDDMEFPLKSCHPEDRPTSRKALPLNGYGCFRWWRNCCTNGRKQLRPGMSTLYHDGIVCFQQDWTRGLFFETTKPLKLDNKTKTLHTHGLSTPMFNSSPLYAHQSHWFPFMPEFLMPSPFLGETPSCFFLLHSFTFFEWN